MTIVPASTDESLSEILPKTNDGDYLIIPKSTVTIIPKAADKSLTEEIYSFATTFIRYHQKFRSYLRSHPKQENEAENIFDKPQFTEQKLAQIILNPSANQLPNTTDADINVKAVNEAPKVETQIEAPDVKKPKSNQSISQLASKETLNVVSQPQPIIKAAKIETQEKLSPKVSQRLVKPASIALHQNENTKQVPLDKSDAGVPENQRVFTENINHGPIVKTKLLTKSAELQLVEKNLTQNEPKIKKMRSLSKEHLTVNGLSPTESIETTEPQQITKPEVTQTTHHVREKIIQTQPTPSPKSKDHSNTDELLLSPTTTTDDETKKPIVVPPTKQIMQTQLPNLKVKSNTKAIFPATNDKTTKLIVAPTKVSIKSNSNKKFPNEKSQKNQPLLKEIPKKSTTKIPNLQRIAVEIQKNSSTKKQPNTDENFDPNVEMHHLDELNEITEPDVDDVESLPKVRDHLALHGLDDGDEDDTEDEDDEDEKDDDEPLLKKQPFVPPFPFFPEYEDSVQDPVDHELYENLAFTNRSEL